MIVKADFCLYNVNLTV